VRLLEGKSPDGLPGRQRARHQRPRAALVEQEETPRRRRLPARAGKRPQQMWIGVEPDGTGHGSDDVDLRLRPSQLLDGGDDAARVLVALDPLDPPRQCRREVEEL